MPGARAVVVAGIIFVGLLGMGMGVGGVAADDTNESNATNVTGDDITETVEDAVNETDGSDDADSDPEGEDDEIRFDNGLVIENYEFSDDYVWIEMRADGDQGRTSITITDDTAGLGEEGVTNIPRSQHAIRSSGETVSMPVSEFGGGHSVTVSSGGQAVRLSTDMESRGEDPFSYFGGQSGVFSGIGLAIITSLAGAGWVLRRENSGVVKA